MISITWTPDIEVTGVQESGVPPTNRYGTDGVFDPFVFDSNVFDADRPPWVADTSILPAILAPEIR